MCCSSAKEAPWWTFQQPNILRWSDSPSTEQHRDAETYLTNKHTSCNVPWCTQLRQQSEEWIGIMIFFLTCASTQMTGGQRRRDTSSLLTWQSFLSIPQFAEGLSAKIFQSCPPGSSIPSELRVSGRPRAWKYVQLCRVSINPWRCPMVQEQQADF